MLDVRLLGFFEDDFYSDYAMCRCSSCGKLMRMYLDDKANNFLKSETMYKIECPECVEDDAAAVWFTSVDGEEDAEEEENDC